MGASARGAGWMVSLLLQCGADVNTRHGHNGTTALHKAAYWGHRETVLLLLEVCAYFRIRSVRKNLYTLF